ncbi:hypothetical protein, partial [Escherichia coli]|uniref:hypothetical protein n=1 Tax=Escherichia coli TaxID=562 RepID=UPI003EE38CBB
QTSQIHKKDNHIRGQARFCPHKRLNNAFMLHASTIPFFLSRYGIKNVMMISIVAWILRFALFAYGDP